MSLKPLILTAVLMAGLADTAHALSLGENEAFFLKVPASDYCLGVSKGYLQVTSCEERHTFTIETVETGSISVIGSQIRIKNNVHNSMECLYWDKASVLRVTHQEELLEIPNWVGFETCEPNAPEQLWTLKGISENVVQIENVANYEGAPSQCLDRFQAGNSLQTPVSMYNCNNFDHQKFTVEIIPTSIQLK